jgi:hypothetical protein
MLYVSFPIELHKKKKRTPYLRGKCFLRLGGYYKIQYSKL